ncbi:MAG: ATP-binding protein [Gemmatimonadaceae bacterium]
MLHSIRARLAAWYTGVFALFLAAFGAAAYLFLSYSIRERVDEFLAETSAAVAGAMEFERKQGATERVAIDNVVREYRLRETQIAVLEQSTGIASEAKSLIDSGTVAARVTTPPVLPDIQTWLLRAGSAPSVRTIVRGRMPIRFYALPYTLGKSHLVIGVAQSMRPQERILREAELGLALGIPVLLSLATLGGYLLARKSLEQVVVMGARAEAIGAANLHERIPVLNPRDELGRLATVFNGLLGRIEESFEAQRRFMADASHELRTPVAIISGESELALARRDRSSAELHDALQTVRDESRRLREIVDDLFLLAQVNAGERPIRRENMYLRDVIEECLRGARTLASEQGVTLNSDLTTDDMALVGDETLLKRAVMNLIDNAIKYTPSGGKVSVTASRDTDQQLAIVDVVDTGPGVPPESRERIFDRFFRAPPTQDVAVRPSGAGLGLAISRWVTRAHGGDTVLLQSSASGSTFRITVPLPA